MLNGFVNECVDEYVGECVDRYVNECADWIYSVNTT